MSDAAKGCVLARASTLTRMNTENIQGEGEFLLCNIQVCLKYFCTLLPGRSLQLISLRKSQPQSMGKRLFICKYPSLFIARYQFKQLSELEQHRLIELIHGSTRQHTSVLEMCLGMAGQANLYLEVPVANGNAGIRRVVEALALTCRLARL